MKSLTVVTVNYRTPNLLIRSFESVVQFYPNVRYILVDNGECRHCINFIRETVIKRPDTIGILNSSNVGHGIGMHQALEVCTTKYAFMFDTDCTMIKKGLFSLMRRVFREDKSTYAVGSLGYVNHIGLSKLSDGILYVHPSAMMLNRRWYLELDPFILHGAPCISNMRSAVEKGYRLADIPIETMKEYYTHDTKGTVRVVNGIPNWDIAREAHPSKARGPGRVLPHTRTEIITNEG